jgi:hypothetical protein
MNAGVLKVRGVETAEDAVTDRIALLNGSPDLGEKALLKARLRSWFILV